MALTYLLVSVFGLAIGSFLSVCIHRIPKRTSVVRPRSHCVHCGHQLRVWENLPIVSFLLLRAKCSQCRQTLSWVYPATELITAIALLLLFAKYGFSWSLVVNGLFSCILIVLMFIDLHERILPDPLTLGGAVLGFFLSPLQSSEFFADSRWWVDMLSSLVGILLGGGILWIVAVLYLKWRKLQGLGFGDIKMMAMVGAFLGWRFAWLTIFLGSVLGVVLGSVYILGLRKGARYELPFGTFLGFTGLGVVLWGPGLLRWYLGT